MNIWNYDETCLTDDPGQEKVIIRKGTKYPERIINASKANISVMFAGSAAGELMPPYVVYKSTHLWNTWTNGGPPGTRYNITKSGWFDSLTFLDWFESMMLPKLKRQVGKTVLIGDNLSSHLSSEVIAKCNENNVYFVCLPPGTTHLTQPLDVAVFRPTKIHWRQILTLYKEGPTGKKQAVLQKDNFPQLLNKLFENLNEKIKINLQSGFKNLAFIPVL